MSIEIIVERVAIALLIPGFGWLLITMFVLHYSELKNGKFSGSINFWPFYKQMKEAYPAGSQWARWFTYAGFALIVPWMVWKIIGA